MILVNGTDHDSLEKGPGRDLRTFMPGQGELVYVAGHRTTYLAPFAHIDKLRPGDTVTFQLPYATFHYEITGHRVEMASDPSTRPGDVPIYISDCHALSARTSWVPRRSPTEILRDIHVWVCDHEGSLLNAL